MEDNENIDQDYQKGFNEGYIMKKYLPDVADKLEGSLTNSARSLGFKDGREEFVLEQKRDKYPAWRKADWTTKTDQSTLEDKSKDLEKDIEGPEPEL